MAKEIPIVNSFSRAVENVKVSPTGGPVICVDPVLGDDKEHVIFWRYGQVVIGGQIPKTKGDVLTSGGAFGPHIISGNEE